MQRIVDISSEGLHLSVHRGFLSISLGQQVSGRIPLDDIAGLITHAHGLTWSNAVAVQLAERAVPIVLSAPNHKPVACVWPIEGHHLQNLRMRQQSGASKPLIKRLWRDIVVAKIQMQKAVLAQEGQQCTRLGEMIREVQTGDARNHEAQAARYYWPLLMGANFRRDTDGIGPNALLNYGYAILRACVARAVCAGGLHPTLGLQHSNRANAFALVDDLMEPFRPLVDLTVRQMLRTGTTEVTPQAKRKLVMISDYEWIGEKGRSSLSEHCNNLVFSLATCFAGEATGLSFPSLPGEADFANFMRAVE